MKIWFPVIKGGSGTDVFTRRLADALRRRGIATEITWFPAYFQLAPFLLRHVPPPPGTNIIHANSWNGFAFKRPEIPLLVTEHLNVLDPLYRPYKSLPQHIYHKALICRFVMASFHAASAITAVSCFTAAGLSKALGTHAQVIHNWINTVTFSQAERNIRSINRPFRLLFMGNLSRRKGADLLVPIMRELGQEFELSFTSGLNRLGAIRAEQNMVPLGRLIEDRELVKAYHRCDALLFPSRFEGLPLAPLEAMACGKPVIAANISSLPEVVKGGETGILCPPDQIDTFVTACRKLAEDPQIARNYGQAARRRAENLFSEQIVVPQYVSLYQRLACS